MSNLAEDVMMLIHQSSPYESFDASAYPLDVQGWLSGEGVLDQLIDQLRPKIIIEVGTWKGASAFYLIERARQRDPEAVIICVDTWLGSPEHFLTPHWRSQLKLKHGRAQLYEQFIANVIHKEMTDFVVPLCMPSVQAARLLEELGIRAALVHIDGAHDARSVRHDIEAFWPLIVPQGAMVGDDYIPEWPGVIQSADTFINSASDIEISGTGDTRWFVQKKSASA